VFLIYQIGIRLYYLIILLASPFSRKAGDWLSGRRNNQDLLSGYKADKNRHTLWMHVSSLGEFEQGRPVIERWKAQFPDSLILLSFYSPSGFNFRKNYPLADLIFYLPVDTHRKMEKLVDQLKPDLFILVKYDFWPNLLAVLKEKAIPVYLISARFRRDQYLFKKWGRIFLQQLRDFKWIFVQDESSFNLLKDHSFNNIVVAGDTRVDAVMNRDFETGRRGDRKTLRRGDFETLRRGDFETGRRVLIGGSTWPVEEKMLSRLWHSSEFKELKKDWRLVIAPHDISETHLVQIEALFPDGIIRHSRIEGPGTEAFPADDVILIDSIGLLSSLYAYADLAFIGGGFGKGIHNILEPAAFGLPVVIGPNWTKFREAESLIGFGAAFPINDYEDFLSRVMKLCSDSDFRTESGVLAVSYMKSQMGSSDLIIRYLLGKW
jgi:3-deoxy-D-manno-octulosonic-acid transferase